MSRSYPGKEREEQGYSRQKQSIYRVVRKRAHAMLRRIQDGKHERDDIVYMHAKSLQSCLTLFNPLDCSPPGSFAHGILQARILEWVAISYSRDSSGTVIEPTSLVSPAVAGKFFTTASPGKPIK